MSLQSPGAINNPEVQLLDFPYNANGGSTIYEIDRANFDFIRQNGIEIIIDIKKNTK